MKKKFKCNFILIVIFLVCIIFLLLKFCDFGSKTYQIPINSIKINIPSLSRVVKSTDNYIVLKTPRSKYTIKKELENSLLSFKKYNCGSSNKSYFYNKEQNYTIISYSIKNKILYNEVIINYELGKFDFNTCARIVDYKNIKYKIIPPNDTGYCYIPESFSVNSKNNINYKIHYKCFGNLAIENNFEKYIYFDQILSYDWLKLDDFFKFLDYQTEKEKFKKYEQAGNILYRGNDFDLLYCSKSNEIYINKEINLSNNFCEQN